MRGISHQQIRGLFDAANLPSLDRAFIAKWLELFTLLGCRGIADLIVQDSARPAAVEFFSARTRRTFRRGGSPE
jgi:hypothetical protein